MDHLNAAQVLALAPDAASAKAGQNLSSPARWFSLGRAGSLVWGESQGGMAAAAEPCRTQADLGGAASHCSCRSRKTPCKHALGLLLLVAANPARVPAAAAPDWVKTRPAKVAATRRGRLPARSDTALDPTAGSAAALEEVQAWLSELISEGLGQARQQPTAFFEQMAARLADARTPGLARRLRTWPAIFASDDEEWASRALEETGSLQLLLNSAARLDELPANSRVSVCTALGWPIDEGSLLAGSTGAEIVTDTWLAVGRRVEPNGGARIRRTWLLGQRTARTALCLAPGDDRRKPEGALVPGTAFDADLAFYPGTNSLRANVQARRDGAGGPAVAGLPPAQANFAEALDRSLSLLAADPWLEPTPWFVRGCVPDVRHRQDPDGRTGEHWTLRDGSDAIVPLAEDFPGAWQLLAASGGEPVTVFGEWNGRTLLPLSTVAAGRFINLAAAEENRTPYE